MRDIKELLILLLESVKEESEISFFGMCCNILELEDDSIITNDERHALETYLKDMRPVDTGDSIFWWYPVVRAPRIEWLENQIKSL
jgi:hypothetical protein